MVGALTALYGANTRARACCSPQRSPGHLQTPSLTAQSVQARVRLFLRAITCACQQSERLQSPGLRSALLTIALPSVCTPARVAWQLVPECVRTRAHDRSRRSPHALRAQLGP